MSDTGKTFSKIIGTGSYLPEKILTNADLEHMVETSDEWIVSRTGIRERHIAAEGETTCDMSEKAARLAMESAGIHHSDIDLIIVATTTPDLVFPSTACLLQERLGIHGCPAFDVQAVCTGFIYALTVADNFIRSGSSKRALVVGAETLSRIVDWTDRGTCILFGDGAGAVIVEASDEPGADSLNIKCGAAMYTQALLQQTGSRRKYQIRCGCCYYDQIDIRMMDASTFHSKASCLFRHITGCFTLRCNMTLTNASTGYDPLITGFDHVFKISIGKGFFW